MKTAKITLGGAEYEIARLKSLQVAEFFDAIPSDTASETKTSQFTRSLRTIALALGNAKSALLEGLNLNDDEGINRAIAKIDDLAEWEEIDPAFIKVLDLSGLRKRAEGESQATESTLSESSVAS